MQSCIFEVLEINEKNCLRFFQIFWIFHSLHDENELNADKILPHAMTTEVDKREKYEAQPISWLASTDGFSLVLP